MVHNFQLLSYFKLRNSGPFPPPCAKPMQDIVESEYRLNPGVNHRLQHLPNYLWQTDTPSILISFWKQYQHGPYQFCWGGPGLPHELNYLY